MSESEEATSAAYIAARAQKAALGHQLFELLVLSNWYGTLSVALKIRIPGSTVSEYTYLDEPDFSHRDYGYVGGTSLEDARQYKAAALGESIDDDRLQELVEEVLKEELEKYNVELHWITRNSWDGSDRILKVYPKS